MAEDPTPSTAADAGGVDDSGADVLDHRSPGAGGSIVANPARDYRFKRYILITILLVYGMMSIRDGFYRYPQANADARAKGLDILPYPGYDVQLNMALGVLLPPLAVAFLIWCLYNSRGQYRFDGQTLSVPGHPPVPLNAIRKIDRAKWDRKGIAYIDYQFPGTAKGGRLKLDDFVYQREPTDQIFDQITATIAPATAAQSRPAAVAPPPIQVPPRPGSAR